MAAFFPLTLTLYPRERGKSDLLVKKVQMALLVGHLPNDKPKYRIVGTKIKCYDILRAKPEKIQLLEWEA